VEPLYEGHTWDTKIGCVERLATFGGYFLL